MVEVLVRCPSCFQKGIIELKGDKTKEMNRGLLAVNVSERTVCPHSFLAYVDKNLSVRDYFIADFKIEIPNIIDEEQITACRYSQEDFADMSLIKLNVHAMLMCYILRSIFSKQKIVIILDDLRYRSNLKDEIVNFFKYLTESSFEADVYVTSRVEYFKSSMKDCMVFQGNNIIKNNKKIVNPKKLWVEKQIVHHFMAERELGFSCIQLRNEVHKAYVFTKEIVEFIRGKKGKKRNAILVKKFLEGKYNTKMDQLYINFLIEIVENAYGISVPTMLESLFRVF